MDNNTINSMDMDQEAIQTQTDAMDAVLVYCRLL